MGGLQYAYSTAVHEHENRMMRRDLGTDMQTRYSSRARIALGAAALVALPAVATSPSGSTADFERRCAQPGVVRCVGFDNAGVIKGTYGQPSGIMRGAAEPAIDTSVKASGAGSLKFTIPSNSAQDTSGTYFTNFSDDLSVQFGEKQEFFIQWRQRFSRELISTQYKGGGGFKLIIVGTGDQPKKPYASCTALTVVATTWNQLGFPILYNSCTGSTSHGPYDGLYEQFLDHTRQVNFKLQNARPAPHCLYTQRQTGLFPPNGNCFPYHPDEWMTFQLRIKTGARVNDEFAGSQVTMWMARENKPSEVVIDRVPYNLTAGPPAENQRFGKVWLLPYNTGKDPSEAHPVAYTWYDELIISKSKIPDPAVVPKKQ
jgi:hypothetical protein